MRRLLFGALLLAGCQDYGKLKEDFCATARIHHSASSTAAVAFCDDLETSVVDPAKWQQDVTGGTITPEYLDSSFDFDSASPGTPDHAYRGRGVVYMTAGPSQTAQLVERTITPNQVAPAIRFFFWPGRNPGSGDVPVIELHDAQDNPIRSVSLDNGYFKISDTATGMSTLAQSQIFPEYWSCVEMDSFADHVDLVVDRGLSTEVFFTLGPLPTQAQAASTHLGPRRGADALPTSEMWFDEVIIDSDPSGPSRSIGCAP